MSRDDAEFQLYPVFKDLQSENLDDYICDVEARVAGTKPGERKLLGPPIGSTLERNYPGALARRELKLVELAKDDGH